MADEITPIAHLDKGLTPVFVYDDLKITQEKFIEKVHQETGESQFYLLGHERISFDENKVKIQKYQPRFFIVNYSAIGYTCDAIELESFNDRNESFGRVLEEKASFTLPKIPAKMVAEIDAFFRYVHKKLTTEAIVVLTYDPELEGDNRNDGLGWGYQIPEQENSAGRCDYKHDSIIEHMEESAYVVGSCHSHPMMSAFCSGVDKGDQADFPGVHITFGWGNKGADPGVTHHHIEFQLGDQAWSLKPQQIFADPPSIELPEDLAKLADKRVEKKTAVVKHTSYPGNLNKTQKNKNSQHHNKNTNKNENNYYERRNPKANIERPNLPEELKSIDWNDRNNILVWSPMLNADEIKKCPCCNSDMSIDEVAAFRCGSCHTYVHGLGEKFSTILEHRKESKTLPHAGLSMKPDQSQSIWYVVEAYEDDDADNEGTVLEVECIHEGTSYKKTMEGAAV